MLVFPSDDELAADRNERCQGGYGEIIGPKE